MPILQLFRLKGTDTVLNCNHHSNRFRETTFEFQVSASTVKDVRSSVKWPNGQYRTPCHTTPIASAFSISLNIQQNIVVVVSRSAVHTAAFQDIMFPYYRYGGETACLYCNVDAQSVYRLRLDKYVPVNTQQWKLCSLWAMLQLVAR
jgi:hypothetical protein